MIRLDSSTEHFLNTLASLRERFDQLQRHVSSGVSVERPSDSPEQVDDLVRVKAGISRTEQTLSNLGQVQAEVDTGERTLQRTVRILEEALVLGSQAGSTTFEPSKRAILADQVQELHEEMVALSRTTAGGRYIFGGDADGAPPYEVNLVNPNGVNRLTTAAASREVQTANGLRFLAARTATEIFDHRDSTGAIATDNAFVALHTLAQAVEAGDSAALDTVLTNLRSAQEHVNDQLAFYGRVQSRIEVATNEASKTVVGQRQTQSSLEDTDVAAAALELAGIETNLQASLQSQSAFRLSNLFDFLR